MKYKFILLTFFSFVVCFTFLYFEGEKIKYLQVFLPHRVKPSVVKKKNNTEPKNTSKIIYGVNVDMSQLLPGSSRYIVNDRGEDLIDIANKLGINLFRITSVAPSFGTRGFIYTKSQWDKVLNKMNE